MVEESVKLVYGKDSDVVKEGRSAGVQALSGTGACRLFAEFQRRFHPESHIYFPDPTWSKYVCSSSFGFLQVLVQFFQVVKCLSDNEIDVQISIFSVIEVQSCVLYSHHNIWRDAQIPERNYHYYDPDSKSLDFAALVDDIKVWQSSHSLELNSDGLDDVLFWIIQRKDPCDPIAMFNQMDSLLLIMDMGNTKYETLCYGRKEKLTLTFYRDCNKGIKKLICILLFVDSVICHVKPSSY